MAISFSRVLVSMSMLAVLTSCATAPRPPQYFDANNPLKRVAVLPMKNDTDDVEGPNVVRKKMIEALAHKSYVVKDVKETDQILRDQMGINLGGQLDLTTPQKLGETLGVEGVLYGTLLDFDETTTGILNLRKVRAAFRLVNTQTGQPVWERGLGVRSETRMAGRTGSIASAASRGADSKEKDVPWITIDSIALNESNVGQAFAIGMGAKLLTKAMGIHLEHESKEMARRVTDNLPWGPGSGTTNTITVATPKVSLPKPKMAEPPSFGYADYGKKDFSAVIVSSTVNKSSKETFNFTIPFAKAGERVRMDMDMSKMTKGNEGMPSSLSKISTLHLGDKKIGYTIYPNAKKYMLHKETEKGSSSFEKPHVEKTKAGTETVDGHPTDKYKVKIIYKNGTVDEGYIWNARDLDEMTIKSDVENKDARVTMDLKNIVLKKPSPSLFEIPADYIEAQGFMDLLMESK